MCIAISAHTFLVEFAFNHLLDGIVFKGRQWAGDAVCSSARDYELEVGLVRTSQDTLQMADSVSSYQHHNCQI